MGRRPLALLLLLAISCGEPPPPPPPPPPLPVRLAASKLRLQKLAEEQLAAAPRDERLQVLRAAFQGGETPSTGGPLGAVLRGDRDPAAVEAALPGSSFASLFKAHDVLRKARGNTGYLREAADAVEEALKRNAWDDPVEAYRAWALDWLEKNEPDVPVRVCYRLEAANTARGVLLPLCKIAAGLARAPAPPKVDSRRPADAVRRLVEERFLRSPAVVDVLLGHVAHEIVLEAQFLMAWKQKDLETARSASVTLEDWGRRDAALKGWTPTYLGRRALEDTISRLVQTGVLVPPLGAAPQVTPAPEGPDDATARKEALKEIAAGAKAYWQAIRAEAKPILPELEARRPERSPKRNYLGYALRDREILFNDPFPKDRHEQLLDAAFDGGLDDGQATGLQAYAWVIRENLVRPGSIPSAKVQKRFADKDGQPDRSGQNLDVYAVLKLRKEDVAADRRPSPAAVRKHGASAQLHGYALLLRDAVKTRPAEALEWLPEADGAEPSEVEAMIAETLRGATEKDFGPDWARWKAFLETGN